jgi:hypothetical protein
MTEATIGSTRFFKTGLACFDERKHPPMPRRPNYRFERSERDRVKKAKKEAKIKQQQERAAQRKTGADDPELSEDVGEP